MKLAAPRASSGWNRACVSVLALAAVVALLVPGAALARSGTSGEPSAYVPASLLAAGAASPNEKFPVIVLGRIGVTSARVADDVLAEIANDRAAGDVARARS